MQVGEIAPIDETVRGRETWAWAAEHPHLAFDEDPSNVLYVAADELAIGDVRGVPGAGTFEIAEGRRRLTAAGETPSMWRLPAAFLPTGRSPLSYHADAARWRHDGDRTLLRSAARGQEFVLDLDAYPDVVPWLASVLGCPA